MNVDALIKRIQSERDSVAKDMYSERGMQRLKEVATSYDGEYKLVWSDDLLKEIETRPKSPLHSTGLPLLDKLIGGFKEQQVITVSAHSKHGKTGFSLFLMEMMPQLSPVMIPLEQSNEELVEQRRDNGYSIPRFLSPRKLAARVTLDWVEERIVEGIAKYDSKLIVIDHLGYLDDFGSDGRLGKENLAYRIQILMQGIKNLAKKWNVIIVLLVHISQADESKPPSLQDLKGSSSILQESDMVIMLWRKNTTKKKVRIYDNKTMVSVLANRRSGKNGNIGLTFNTTTGRYDEDNGWVKSMEESAMIESEAEDAFDEI